MLGGARHDLGKGKPALSASRCLKDGFAGSGFTAHRDSGAVEQMRTGEISPTASCIIGEFPAKGAIHT